MLYFDNYFDVVIIDFLYYDNVLYLYLFDFFYVWLKCIVGDLYFDLFVMLFIFKVEEIVVYLYEVGGLEGGKKFFEEMILKVFREIYCVLKDDGIVVIVFVYKSIIVWEIIINVFLDLGFYFIVLWLIYIEMKVWFCVKELAVLVFLIYMVCCKRIINEIVFYIEIKF